MKFSEKLNTLKFVEKHRNMFEDVAKTYDDVKDLNGSQRYSILDYGKILNLLCEYMTGYLNYKEKGNNEYSDKVLSQTIYLYNNMFKDKQYRTKIVLSDMNEINKSFLEGTKKLQTLLDEQTKALETMEGPDASELNKMIALTNNQYGKISKVYHDDMSIYFWLISSKSKFKLFNRYNIDSKLKVDFNDKHTPVMHKLKDKF